MEQVDVEALDVPVFVRVTLHMSLGEVYLHDVIWALT
jgi:hypothetical protein